MNGEHGVNPSPKRLVETTAENAAAGPSTVPAPGPSTVQAPGRGASPLPGGGLDKGVPRSALRALTPREREVLSVLPSGEGNVAIARRLGIAERTVKAHLTSITRKLGLRSRVEAALLSAEWADELRADRADADRT
ncbi:helix-turn-helix domain-containing protein [Streptomyces sp. CA-181903]|uniref:helix-turn-helix domain-containing protein n=1 Tax=Streptomyces sp. CA-181903 TaxID=3240055 RepID=UPI003D9347FA